MTGFTFDGRGLIYNCDYGDTAAETGRYYAGLWFRARTGLSIEPYPHHTGPDLLRCLEHLTPSPGIIIRHPDAPYNEPFKNKFSPGRDQQHPLEVAVSLWAQEDPGNFLTPVGRMQLKIWLTELRAKQQERFLKKYQNWDFPNPSHWAVGERYEAKSYKYPDLYLWGASVLQTYKGDDDVADDLNHTLLLSQAMVLNPTDNTRRAVYAYRARRPLMRWCRYYRPEVSSLWGMPELWRPWLQEAF